MRILLLLLISISCFSQSRVISLEKLALKQEKSDANIIISDHTIDGRGITKMGYELVFTGKGKRGLVFKNFKGTDSVDHVKIIFRDATINNGSSGVTAKLTTSQHTWIYLERSFLNGLPGGTASQMIYWEGPFNAGCGVIGDGVSVIDQGRPSTPGNMAGGACIQIAGSYTSSCNATNWNGKYAIFKNLIVKNANDETIYVNYNTSLHSPKPTAIDWLLIDGVHSINSGRDAFQWTSVLKGAVVKNSSAINGGLEEEPNHISGFSINGDSPNVLIDSVTIEKFGQFVYSRTEGASGKVVIKNSNYIQGNHAGTRANQAMYLTGSPEFSYTIENTFVSAPAALKAAITSDGGTVYWKGDDKFIAPAQFRYFNGGKSVELPVIKSELRTFVVETSSLAGVTTTTLILSDGTRIPIK